MSSPRPGSDVALVLAAERLAGTTGGELLGEVGHIRPHARRALLIGFEDLGQRGSGDEIFSGIAHGRFDHYLLRPSTSPDEEFHQTISTMLLEWAEAQRAAPYTIHVVGESWSGRAYELREALQQCAVPHSFCLRRLRRGSSPRRFGSRRGGAAADGAAQRRGAGEPRQRRDRGGCRRSGEPGIPSLRRCRSRRRAIGPVGRRVRRVRGARHARRRQRGHRWPGHLQLADPELPWLPPRGQRPTAGPGGLRAGVGLRGRLRVHAHDHGRRAGRRRARRLAVGLRPPPHDGGAPRDGRELSPHRDPGTRGAERRRRVLRRPHLGSAWTRGRRHLHRGRGQLGRAGRACTSLATHGRSRS